MARGGKVDLNTRLGLVDAQLADNAQFVSIAKYANNLNTALASETFISIPEGMFTVTPLTRLSLAGKKIKGAGKKSILKFVGDVVCFDIDGIQDCYIEDLQVVVDAINTKDVFRISGLSNESLKNRVSNCWINTADGTEGLYTGVRFISNIFGVYQNTVTNPEIENCKNGVLFEAIGSTAWTTHNLVANPYIKKFTGTAIGFNENPATMIINNIVSNPRIIDWTAQNIERIGVRISGMSNAITNVEIFNDGTSGTFYAFDLTEIGVRSYNNTITGGAEGLIKGEENIVNHIFDVNMVKRKNALDTNLSSDPIRLSRGIVANLISNYNFMNGLGWVATNLTAVKTASINKEYFSKNITLTKTANGSKFVLNLPKPELFVGKYITFTVAIKSSFKAFVHIDEGAPGFLRGSYHTGSGATEILSVSRKIVGGGVVQIAIDFDDTVANGSTLEAEWVCVNYGRLSPNVPLPTLTNYVDKNKGTSIIPAGLVFVVISHGLDITPNIEDISITPNGWWDTVTQYWVSEVTATTFKLQSNAASGAGGFNFSWKAEQ